MRKDDVFEMAKKLSGVSDIYLKYEEARKKESLKKEFRDFARSTDDVISGNGEKNNNKLERRFDAILDENNNENGKEDKKSEDDIINNPAALYIAQSLNEVLLSDDNDKVLDDDTLDDTSNNKELIGKKHKEKKKKKVDEKVNENNETEKKNNVLDDALDVKIKVEKEEIKEVESEEKVENMNKDKKEKEKDNTLNKDTEDDGLDEEIKEVNKYNNITFKGTKSGIEMLFTNDSKVSFEQLYGELAKRIDQTNSVYNGIKCGIVLSGRKFDKRQEDMIVALLRRKMNISIEYINTEGFYDNSIIRKDPKDSRIDYADTMYYHGTLRSGQILTSKSSLVIFGDVNPGSEVVAGGNLIVMGSLRGVVQAGTKSDEAYIIAFDMNPKQLRIGDMIARSADDADDSRIQKPHKAYISDGQICIEPIDGTFNWLGK